MVNTCRYELHISDNDDGNNEVSNCCRDDFGCVFKSKGYDELTLVSDSKYALYTPVEASAIQNWCWNAHIHTNYIEVGLSPALYFDPVVRIRCLNSGCIGSLVIFTGEEWNDFINLRLELCFRKFFDEAGFADTVTEETLTFGETRWLKFRKVINGENSVTIVVDNYSIEISDTEFQQLFVLAPLIKHKIERLRFYSFADFYTSYVKMVSEDALRSNSHVDIIFSATMFCERYGNSELHHIMHEVLTFYQDLFVSDVRMLML